jgi:hypothetical protein
MGKEEKRMVKPLKVEKVDGKYFRAKQSEQARVLAERARKMADEAKKAFDERKAKRESIPSGIPVKDNGGEVLSFVITNEIDPVTLENKPVTHFVPVKGQTAEDAIKDLKLKALKWFSLGLSLSLIVCLIAIFKRKILNGIEWVLDTASDLVDNLKDKINRR